MLTTADMLGALSVKLPVDELKRRMAEIRSPDNEIIVSSAAAIQQIYNEVFQSKGNENGTAETEV